MLRRLLRKRSAYQRTFQGVDADVVLADLARFCHMYATTHVPGDTHGTAQLEGRRQVFLRIQQLLTVDEGEIRAAVTRGAQKETEYE